MCIKNYFLIGPRIIFRGIANLFFGLQCIAGLAFEVDWFESLGAYHLTEKSGRGVESIMVSDLPVYRRNATSVTV